MLYTNIVKNLPLKDKKFWTRSWLTQVVINIVVFVTTPVLLFESYLQIYSHRNYDYTEFFYISYAMYGILVLFYVSLGIIGYFENKKDGWKASLRINSMVLTLPLIIVIFGGFLIYGAYRFYPLIYGDFFEKTWYVIWIVFFTFVIVMTLWLSKDGYSIYKKIETSGNISDLQKKLFRRIKNNFPGANIKGENIAVDNVKIRIGISYSGPEITIRNLKKDNLSTVADIMKVIDEFKMG